MTDPFDHLTDRGIEGSQELCQGSINTVGVIFHDRGFFYYSLTVVRLLTLETLLKLDYSLTFF